jgi:hypothetical protein
MTDERKALLIRNGWDEEDFNPTPMTAPIVIIPRMITTKKILKEITKLGTTKVIEKYNLSYEYINAITKKKTNYGKNHRPN